MANIEKTHESRPFKEMTDNEVEELVKECFDGKTAGARTQDTIVSLRKGTNIVDVFTVVRHRVYEKEK